jgi:hypothetical protein
VLLLLQCVNEDGQFSLSNEANVLRYDLFSFGILRSVEWYFFKGLTLEDGADMLS